MSSAPKPRLIPPPAQLTALGPLVIIDAECAYFHDDLETAPGSSTGTKPSPASTPRSAKTAFALPGLLKESDYQKAMDLGMRRSGTLVYRPLCSGCRKCQPFRLKVSNFVESKSQRRARKRCEGLFSVDIIRPRPDAEHLRLYARYQQDQHGKDGQEIDEEAYTRFLVESVADTWELAWRDRSGKLVGVGIVDLVADGISTVYFYWDPALRDLSLGVASALWEIDLCRRWHRQYYYLGYLVRGSKTMSYKSQFSGGEVWNGTAWIPVPGRDLSDSLVDDFLAAAEADAMVADGQTFPLDGAVKPMADER